MIAVTGGGTGGHLSIAEILAKELKSRGENIIFIGSSRGLDKIWFENSELFKFSYFLDSSGVVNKRGFKKIYALFNIIKLAFKCSGIFKKHSVSSVVSVGGYSSAPAAFGALIFRKKLFIHEQNALLGRLNLVLRPFCTKFFSSYLKIPYSYPVGNKFFDTSRTRKELKTILFLGGSQGASFINSLALDLALSLNEKGINIIHQCGEKELDKVRDGYENLGIQANVFSFSKDIEIHMQKSDICVSRSGASSLWELVANRLPSLFIPYPFAAKNHQFFNAKFLEDSKLTKIYEQENLDKNSLLNDILNLDLNSISTDLKFQISPNGSRKIVDEILKYT